MKKFCILSAGQGTRNSNVVGLHKALLPLDNKPVISHIIDGLDKGVEIVIALGYKSNQVKSYVNLLHSDRNVTFVEVDNFDDVGSGPGYSLLCCKDELQEPFVFTSVDTLIDNDIDLMDIGENWLGVSLVDSENSLNYCLVNGTKYLDNLYYGVGEKAYIGMAGIYEYDKFWSSLEEHKIIKDEYQVIHGFDDLEQIKLIDFTWYDTGNNEAYEEVRKSFPNEVVANKSDEVLFIDKGYVIKYFNNSETVKLRLERVKYLNGNVPKVTYVNRNMYCYDYVYGELLSNITDEVVMKGFLEHCQENLFIKQELSETFIDDCIQMYETKTIERVKSLSGGDLDKIKIINGIEVEPIEIMLGKIEWNRFYDNAIPSYFHGDIQPENILYDRKSNRYVLLDWRQRFGGSVEVGDVYYDLAKLYHALMINGQSILQDMFDYTVEPFPDYSGDVANVEFYSKSNLVYFKDIFKEFCEEHNYYWNNVELLGILQYLNICTLYDSFKGGKYGNFLFLYGKYLLSKFLNEGR
jgi:GTP:adenosylcobinamide-phosphate guanylyltransferase